MALASQFGHVHLIVRDIEQAERFYTDLLGFRVTERIGDQFVFLTLSDRHHDLALQNVGREAAGPITA
jgi:catechol-2,3-dioxygenase